MSIRKTMFVKENTFRKLDDPFNDVAKKYANSASASRMMSSARLLI